MQITTISTPDRVAALLTPRFRAHHEAQITAYAAANDMTIRRATTHYAKAQRLQHIEATRQPLRAEALHRAITTVGTDLANATKTRRTR